MTVEWDETVDLGQIKGVQVCDTDRPVFPGFGYPTSPGLRSPHRFPELIARA
ncbi:hypothetical protein [Laspinema olomoucense]|uniref:Uncharacterized protein n=1 Tax=Laspinema olomoucense D3b TaxID=2953688 RepID=A0ABT2N3Z4_9CYAN|nr:hypothetical protein [Laspinema sp. D3b]MCT7977407.1 hypothetical protein [Laspinema sp. D3b]